MDRSVEKVLQSAGIRLEDATSEIVDCAQMAIDRCYYIDLAAEYLLEVLDARDSALKWGK